jgi:hypothetical protein
VTIAKHTFNMATKIQVYRSQADLSRTLDISAATFRTRCAACGILPDAVVVQSNRCDILLFKSERFAQIRAAVLNINTSATHHD